MTKPDEPDEPKPDGYCISMFDDSVWLTREGTITSDYDQRAVYPTLEEAEAVLRAEMEKFKP